MPDHTPESAEPVPRGNGVYSAVIPPGALNGMRETVKVAPALKERFRVDPAMEIPGMAPNFGQHALPHVMTLQGLVSTVSRTYRISDEALNDSFDHARFMEYDLGIWECIEARTRTVSLLDWHLEPEDDKSQEQIDCCDKLKRIIESIPRFMQLREQLLLAIWYGRSAVSLRYAWNQCGREWYVMPTEDMNGDMAWTPVHGDKLVFRLMDGRLDHLQNQVGVRVGQTYNVGDRIQKKQLDRDGFSVSTHWQVEPTDRGLAYFLTPDERKLFIIHKHQIQDSAFERPTDAGRVHGVGIRSRLYWEWFQKQNTLQWLMEYIERSAFGLELWFYPLGNEKARTDAETAVKNRVGPFRNVLFVPVPPDDGAGQQYGVQHVETGLQGADLLLQMIEKFFGHRIKRLILGQVLTSEAEATGLGGNLANIHLLTFRDIVKYDAVNLGETLTGWVNYSVKPWNFPKASHFKVKFVIDTEPIDSDAKMSALEKAYGMGARIKENDVFEAIGASAPGPTDRILPPPGAGGGGMGGLPPGGPQNGSQTPKTPLGEVAQKAMDDGMGKNEPDVGGEEKKPSDSFDGREKYSVTDSSGHKHDDAGLFTGSGGDGESSKDSPKSEPMRVADFKNAGSIVDGREVLSNVPNMGSIDSTVDDPEILPGIREVPLSAFSGLSGKAYSASETNRIKKLADEIKQSKQISPLIVVDDGHPEGPYILEGGHRAEALYLLGAKSFPAVVVRDLRAIADKDGGKEQYTVTDSSGHKHDDKGLFTGDGSGGGGKAETESREKEVKKIIKDAVGPQTVTQARAKTGGEIGPNGEFYKGGAFIATTDMPKRVKKKIEGAATGKVQVDGYKWEVPKPGQMSILDRMGGTVLNPRNGDVNYQYLEYQKATSDEVSMYEELADKWKSGVRWVSVNDYPDLAGIKDAARLVVAGEPVPGAVLDKLPAEWKEHLTKYQSKKSETHKPAEESQSVKQGIEGLAKTGSDGGKHLGRGDKVKFHDGEHKGHTIEIEGIIPMRYRKEQVTYRGQIEGIKGGAGQVTITADQLSKQASLEQYSHKELRDAISNAAKETDTDPSKEQKEAGDYRKGVVSIHGLQIAIENPKGSYRHYGDETAGKKQKMTCHYGYIKGVPAGKSKDGGAVDCFIGPDPESDLAYIVDQLKPNGGWDEVKILLGWYCKEEAREGYLSNYESGWKGLGNITPMTIGQLKAWLEKGNMKRPFVNQREFYCQQSGPQLHNGEWF